MLDYNMPYHVLEEEEDYTFIPKLSFKSFGEAKDFVRFCPKPNLIIVKTRELKNYFLELEYKNKEL